MRRIGDFFLVVTGDTVVLHSFPIIVGYEWRLVEFVPRSETTIPENGSVSANMEVIRVFCWAVLGVSPCSSCSGHIPTYSSLSEQASTIRYTTTCSLVERHDPPQKCTESYLNFNQQSNCSLILEQPKYSPPPKLC